jgi:hypothetical protein
VYQIQLLDLPLDMAVAVVLMELAVLERQLMVEGNQVVLVREQMQQTIVAVVVLVEMLELVAVTAVLV